MDVLDLMTREMLRRGFSHKTIVTYRQCVKQFMRFCRKDFRKVTKKDIREYLDRMISKGVCGNTINVHINALKFVIQEILRRRVMLKIRYSKTPKSLPTFLTKEEVIKLFSAVENPKHLLILEIIYSAGLRVSEAVNLKKEDLDFSRSIGWVRKGKGNKDRPFIIAKFISERLRAYVSSNNSKYVFSGRRGRPLHVRSVQEIIKAAAKKAGINKNVHPHSLRHSFATHLIENGYDIAAVQSLLGHNSAETTMIYVHMAAPSLSVRSPYDEIEREEMKNKQI